MNGNINKRQTFHITPLSNSFLLIYLQHFFGNFLEHFFKFSNFYVPKFQILCCNQNLQIQIYCTLLYVKYVNWTYLSMVFEILITVLIATSVFLEFLRKNSIWRKRYRELLQTPTKRLQAPSKNKQQLKILLRG